jgi:hypothetical protein
VKSAPFAALGMTGVTGLLLAPAAAPAAMVTTDHACYVGSTPVTLTGTGFEPGRPVVVRNEQPFEVPATDAAGAFAVAFPAPVLPTIEPRFQRFTLTATEPDNPAMTAATTFLATTFAVKVTPARAQPSHRVRYRMSGFPPGVAVYGHWRFRHRTRKTIRIGSADVPCGFVSRRIRQIPVRAHVGTWDVQFDTHRRYSRRSVPRLALSISVVRAAGRASARAQSTGR